MLLKIVDRVQLAGAVTLIASADGVLSVEAVGSADLETGTPMPADAVFWAASMTKPVTATAVMTAVDDGLIDLDVPVSVYLPDFAPRVLATSADRSRVELRDPARPITVRMLLSHTSGLPFSSVAEAPTFDLAPIATQVAAYSLAPLLGEPGEDFSYSNAGFNVAARVLEVVTGMPYEAFLQQRLFDPLGMLDTTFWPSETQVARIATSYKPTADGLEAVPVAQVRYPLSDRENRFPFAGGGLFSTAADLGTFCRMVLRGGELDGHRYLSIEAVREMSTYRVDRGSPPGGGYGLGWAVQPDGSFGHRGAYSTMMRIHPARGLAIVWMVHYMNSPIPSTTVDDAFEDFERAALERF